MSILISIDNYSEVMNMDKNVNNMSVTELKALCFDFDQEIKSKQSQLSQIARVLQAKIIEENKEEEVVEDGV